MGNSYAYNCTSLEVVRPIGAGAAHCKFQCENEHGHELSAEEGIVLANGRLLGDVDDLVVDWELELSDAEREAIQNVVDYSPDYDLYNEEEVAKWLEEALAE